MMPAQLGTYNFVSLLYLAGRPCYPRRPLKGLRGPEGRHLSSPQGRADCKGRAVSLQLGSEVFELYIVAARPEDVSCRSLCGPLDSSRGVGPVSGGLREAGCIYATAPRG